MRNEMSALSGGPERAAVEGHISWLMLPFDCAAQNARGSAQGEESAQGGSYSGRIRVDSGPF
jgi:hypothetical protein